MDKLIAIKVLKTLLKRDLAYLCWRSDRLWNKPIVQTLRDLRDSHSKAVFFGGTLRSLLFSRLLKGSLGRPRDVDIVVAEVTLEELRAKFRDIISRETRFGGLQLVRSSWQFDIWPLNRTWAFIEDKEATPTFNALPSTTFFNLEAIAVEVWPSSGTSRITYSGNDQFFEGILNRTLEINREDNPFPALCIARALVLASVVDLKIGPKLASYLTKYYSKTTNDDLGIAQIKHYGNIKVAPTIMRSWLDCIVRHVDDNGSSAIQLPLTRQMAFCSESDHTWPMLNDYVMQWAAEKEASASTSQVAGTLVQ